MTELNTRRFYRKPFGVDAVQVTEENLGAITSWCDGNLKVEWTAAGQAKNYVKVPVLMPLNERQEKAYVGDWVLKSETGWKVYTDRAFHKAFAPDLIMHFPGEFPEFTGLMTDEELADAVVFGKELATNYPEPEDLRRLHRDIAEGKRLDDDALELEVVDVLQLIKQETDGAIVNEFNKEFNRTAGANVLPVIDNDQLREMTAGTWEPPKLETIHMVGSDAYYEGYQFLITDGDARVPHFIITWAEENNGGWFDVNDANKPLPRQGVGIDAADGAMVVINNGIPYKVGDKDWVLRNKKSGKFFIIGEKHIDGVSYIVL